MTFISQLEVHSTCRDCGEPMLVTRDNDHVHPTCEYTPTKLESLATGWLSCVLAGDHESAILTAKEIDELDAKAPQLHRAATRYAEWGWPVFPLVTYRKTPGTKRGFKDATTDIGVINNWWSPGYNYNIGLPTGHKFDVIDIDSKNGGVESFLRKIDKIPPVHGIACTASGGLHLYVKRTGKGNFAGLYPGIDYRGKGGYVVAPPSWLGSNATRYTWLTLPSPLIKESEF